MMAFVRTNADHHSVVIADAAVNTLNHVAFQLPGWEGVMRASGRMIDAGFKIGWGPGVTGRATMSSPISSIRSAS